MTHRGIVAARGSALNRRKPRRIFQAICRRAGGNDHNRRFRPSALMVGPMIDLPNISRWRASPCRFVRDVFGVTPDPWQDEVLAAFPKRRAWR